MTNSLDLVRNYYECFNKKMWPQFLGLLDEHVIHEVNSGNAQHGRAAFTEFMNHMNRCYDERVVDLCVFSAVDAHRVAAEFYIEGTYLATDGSFPPAKQQKYRLRVGAFFEIKDQKITRVTNYYNLPEWLRQIQ